MPSQALAILWVQWRSIWNLRPGDSLGGRMLAVTMALFWYGLWTTLAVGAAVLLSDPGRREILNVALPWAFLLVTVYWQLTPILTASLGASLSLNKLLIYPIPHGQLFLIELLLRLSTGLEMILVVTGMTLGLLFNPAVPSVMVLPAAPVFVLLNLFLAAGLRSLLVRLVAYKLVREVMVFLVVLSAALPQLLAATGLPPFLRRAYSQSPLWVWPWTATGRLALGQSIAIAWMVLCAWTLAAYFFGRWQFHRSLRFDTAAVEAASRPATQRTAWTDRLYRIPGWLFSDPLAAIVEKELRSLFRTPRFRLVFVMGFTFGFLIWIPLLRSSQAARWRPPENFALIVSVYALLLLSEVVFWNVFGFDRAATQLYFAAPIPFSKVLTGKNLTAVILIVLEVSVVALVCLLLRLPLPAGKIFETYAVLLVLCLYLLATGNLSSLYHPRAVAPDQSWGRATGGKFQVVMVLLFPVLGAPVLLAYAARYAFESQLAFYGVLVLVAFIGAAYYRAAMDSAVTAAEKRKEKLLAALGQGAGPLTQ